MVDGYRRGISELKPFSAHSLCKFVSHGLEWVTDSPGIQHSPGRMLDMIFIDRMNQKCIAALFAVALSSGSIAGDAVVGRESNAAIRARVVELVNDARTRDR